MAILACMKYARLDNQGMAYAALAPGIDRDPRAGIAQQQATGSPTATITPTLTATGTLSPTVTVTGTATLTPTATASLTWTPAITFSPSPTASPTSQATVSATATPDLVGTLLALPTEILTSTLSEPGAMLTETATLIPFPEITIEVPPVTVTDAWNYLAAPPGSGGLPKGSVPIWTKLGRWWPLLVLLVFWLVLAIWFLVLRLLDRK